jgi:hypothetical protein
MSTFTILFIAATCSLPLFLVSFLHFLLVLALVHLQSIVMCVKDRALYFAERLYKSMKVCNCLCLSVSVCVCVCFVILLVSTTQTLRHSCSFLSSFACTTTLTAKMFCFASYSLSAIVLHPLPPPPFLVLLPSPIIHPSGHGNG